MELGENNDALSFRINTEDQRDRYTEGTRYHGSQHHPAAPERVPGSYRNRQPHRLAPSLSGNGPQAEGFRLQDIVQLLVFFAGMGTLTIALLTVGFQAIKAAYSDPAKTLKYE